jgi:hypothetical protein
MVVVGGERSKGHEITCVQNNGESHRVFLLAFAA